MGRASTAVTWVDGPLVLHRVSAVFGVVVLVQTDTGNVVDLHLFQADPTLNRIFCGRGDHGRRGNG